MWRINCREIGTADTDGVANLLASGFCARTSEFWTCALKRLSEHTTPSGYPKYGYLLEYNGHPVGVILLIFSTILVNREPRIRCNVSSWYVEPAFRGYAAMLVSCALKYKHVTYLNTTPAPHTLSILEAQGYVRYCYRVGLCACLRSVRGRTALVSKSRPRDLFRSDCQRPNLVVLTHAKYGCISLTCSSANRNTDFHVHAEPQARAALRLPCLLSEFGRFRSVCRTIGAVSGPARIPSGRPRLERPGPWLIGKYSPAFPKYFEGPDINRV